MNMAGVRASVPYSVSRAAIRQLASESRRPLVLGVTSLPILFLPSMHSHQLLQHLSKPSRKTLETLCRARQWPLCRGDSRIARSHRCAHPAEIRRRAVREPPLHQRAAKWADGRGKHRPYERGAPSCPEILPSNRPSTHSVSYSEQ